jgi:uncharacterized protein YbjT (DUF2867 family)
VIVVAGSTGHVGGEICRILLEQGQAVRALVRPTTDAAKVDALRALGAEVTQGDLRDADSLRRACAGARAVVTTVSAIGTARTVDAIVEVDGAGQIALIDAARMAEIGHFLLLSYSGNLEVDTHLNRAKRGAEQHLRRSGMGYTILRPTFFMESWLSPALGFDVPNGSITIYGAGTDPISYISAADVAAFCATAAVRPAADATLELGGPEPVAPLDAVRIAEEVTGRGMAVQHVPEEALRAQYDAAEDPLQQVFAGLILGLVRGDAVPMEQVLRAFPMRLRSVREFMQQAYGATGRVVEPDLSA